MDSNRTVNAKVAGSSPASIANVIRKGESMFIFILVVAAAALAYGAKKYGVAAEQNEARSIIANLTTAGANAEQIVADKLAIAKALIDRLQ